MTPRIDQTHDGSRRSWVESANAEPTDFPLQNLPFGIFRPRTGDPPRPGVAIGDQILDLPTAARAGLLPADAAAACQATVLNGLMALGPEAWTRLRQRLSELLGADTCRPGPTRDKLSAALHPQHAAELLLPAQVGDYTDFYASIFHATNVGSMLRPDQPLLPNYRWVPIGYHGRASSLVVSGTPVRRPHGQSKPADAPAPAYAPSRSLDYELELGCFVGPGNPLGTPIRMGDAHRHLFGVVLLNDWSARDIQAWEYQPLGPFLAKNFATTLSPWVVTLDALAPFRTAAFVRGAGDPAPLPYLTDAHDAAHGGLDLTLEVFLLTEKMRAARAPAPGAARAPAPGAARAPAAGAAPHRLSAGNFQTMYWTLAQLLAHHASNGCNLQPGDLLGSGTVSGPGKDSRGCLLELTWRGAEPLRLPNGEERRFLADGDEVIFRGHAARAGFRRIGLGECRGLVLPAAKESC